MKRNWNRKEIKMKWNWNGKSTKKEIKLKLRGKKWNGNDMDAIWNWNENEIENEAAGEMSIKRSKRKPMKYSLWKCSSSSFVQ